ncbi:hypothetical protein Droror1_Dr00020328, partial [Drosera rotundifolia]
TFSIGRRSSSVTVLVIAGLMASKRTLSSTYVSINLLSVQNSAMITVPRGPTVACSKTKAFEWDAAWANNLDTSGKATLEVVI